MIPVVKKIDDSDLIQITKIGGQSYAITWGDLKKSIQDYNYSDFFPEFPESIPSNEINAEKPVTRKRGVKKNA